MLFVCTPVTSVAFVVCARRNPSPKGVTAMHDDLLFFPNLIRAREEAAA